MADSKRKTAAKARKTTDKRPKVLVTGISGNLGRMLAKRLHRMAEVHGVDQRTFPGCPKDVTVRHIDLRKKRCEDLFRKNRYKAVYHLGTAHGPRQSLEEQHSINLGGTRKILEYCQRYRVPKVVLLSSATIYGAHPGNPIFLSEEAPLNAGVRFPQISDLIELDMLAQSFFWKHAEIETVILRPVNIVGPHMKNRFTRYLRQSFIPTLMGFDPMMQIVHEDDAIEALVLAMKPGVRGVFNITGPTAVPMSELVKASGAPSAPVPLTLFKFAVRKLWGFKLTSFRAEEIDYMRFICTVDGSRARELLGYEPSHSVRETVQSLRREIRQ